MRLSTNACGPVACITSFARIHHHPMRREEREAVETAAKLATGDLGAIACAVAMSAHRVWLFWRHLYPLITRTNALPKRLPKFGNTP